VISSPVVESLFAALSSARGTRIFHPEGSVHCAEAHIFDCFPGLLHGTFPADFRLSRAFGLPSELGDFYGLAVRLYGDRHGVADLLFASSFDGAAGK
jgi:hypothetical protein